jgi:hypothetical protein
LTTSPWRQIGAGRSFPSRSCQDKVRIKKFRHQQCTRGYECQDHCSGRFCWKQKLQDQLWIQRNLRRPGRCAPVGWRPRGAGCCWVPPWGTWSIEVTGRPQLPAGSMCPCGPPARRPAGEPRPPAPALATDGHGATRTAPGPAGDSGPARAQAGLGASTQSPAREPAAGRPAARPVTQ